MSNLSGHIVAGHGRREAGIRAKIKEFPVVFQDFKDEVAEYAFIQADNAIALWAELDLSGINSDIGDLGPDFDLDLLGIKNFTLDASDKLEPGCDEDEVPESKPEPKVVRGEVYILGNHRLMCGDSTSITDVERLMDGKKAELCFTSPPYGQQRDYGEAKEKVQDWVQLMQDVFSIIPVTDSAQVLVNLGLIHREGEWVAYWEPWIEIMQKANWKRFGWYVWDQGPGLPGDWNGRLAPAFEFIFHFCKTPKKPNKTKECKWAGEENHGSGLRGKDGSVTGYSHAGKSVQTHKIPDSVIRVSRHKARGIEVAHPAVFSVELVEELVSAYSKKNDIVFEPFAGSGTSAIGCEKQDRFSFMMELDPVYCGIILDRWQKFTGKKAHRDDGVAWDEIRGTE